MIYIKSSNENVKMVDTSDTYATESDIEGEEYISIPNDDLDKKKEIFQNVILHDLDMAKYET